MLDIHFRLMSASLEGKEKGDKLDKIHIDVAMLCSPPNGLCPSASDFLSSQRNMRLAL